MVKVSRSEVSFQTSLKKLTKIFLAFVIGTSSRRIGINFFNLNIRSFACITNRLLTLEIKNRTIIATNHHWFVSLVNYVPKTRFITDEFLKISLNRSFCLIYTQKNDKIILLVRYQANSKVARTTLIHYKIFVLLLNFFQSKNYLGV